MEYAELYVASGNLSIGFGLFDLILAFSCNFLIVLGSLPNTCMSAVVNVKYALVAPVYSKWRTVQVSEEGNPVHSWVRNSIVEENGCIF